MANFYDPGAVDIYFKPRTTNYSGAGFLYLGSAVTAPDIEAEIVVAPFTCDLTGSAPFQLILEHEMHEVTATLNRLNFVNWQFLKTRFQVTPSTIRNTEILESFPTTTLSSTLDRGSIGQPILENLDCQVYISYSNNRTVGFNPPDGATKNRLYYSAYLRNYQETTVNNRVEEISIILSCYPLYKVIVLDKVTGNTKLPTAPVLDLYVDNSSTVVPPPE